MEWTTKCVFLTPFWVDVNAPEFPRQRNKAILRPPVSLNEKLKWLVIPILPFQVPFSYFCIDIRLETLPKMDMGLEDSNQGLQCNRAGCATNLPSLGSRTGWVTYCRFLYLNSASKSINSLFKFTIVAIESQVFKFTSKLWIPKLALLDH